MADIDRAKFAFAVAGFLERHEMSYREAQAEFEGVTAGNLSRISKGTVISAANMLSVCRAFELDPFQFLDLQAQNTFAHSNVFQFDKSGVSQNKSTKSRCSTL